nr:MAG TPA: DNA-binding protein [Caudoviricetes sp.]
MLTRKLNGVKLCLVKRKEVLACLTNIRSLKAVL